MAEKAMQEQRAAGELSLEQLEQLLAEKRRLSKARWLRRLDARARSASFERPPRGTSATPSVQIRRTAAGPSAPGWPSVRLAPRRGPMGRLLSATGRVLGWIGGFWVRQVGQQLLLTVELVALTGLFIALFLTFSQLQALNEEIPAARAETANSSSSDAVPVAQPRLLPGGSWPTAAGGVPAPARARPEMLEESIEPEVAAPTGLEPDELTPDRRRSASAASTVPRLEPVSRIAIPSIGVDAPVVEGDSWEELKYQAGHHPGSAQPGERGNAIISAHNDVYGQIFRRLGELKPGDEVQLYRGELVYTYRVTGSRVVEPTETSVLAPSEEATLTLITCFPYLIDTHRLIVLAELSEDE